MNLPLDLNKKLNIAYINLCTEAEGPYKRMAIWFQGCNILCPECCNPELQPLKVAHIMTIQEVVDIALKAQDMYGIEGVTFLGGEPTLQEGIGVLAKTLGDNGLGTILFTGMSIELLHENIICDIDLVIDGRFDIRQVDTNRNLIGSLNQNIYFLTERYKKDIEWFYNLREKKVEINLGRCSELFVTGDVL